MKNAADVENLPAIEEMSVTAGVSDVESHDSDVLGKRKRKQTNRFDPSKGFPAGGPSKNPSKKTSVAVKEVLDEVSASTEIEAMSCRVLSKKILLDLTDDEADSEDDDLVEIANELESLASFNKNQ